MSFPWLVPFDVEAYRNQLEWEEENIVKPLLGLEETLQTPKRKRRHHNRNHALHDQNLFNDYFAENALYKDFFRRRFRMEKHVFLRIVGDLSNYKPAYFTQQYDAVGKQGLSPLAKCTTAMRMLAYGMSADAIDEYIKIGGTTALDALREFCKGVVALYGQQYMRAPTEEDLRRILAVNEDRGFPGMIGSVDCMHWEWKNCPKGWEGQFTRGDKGTTSVILEAVATQDLWIWHSFFGSPSTLNDINVLDRSPLFDDLEQGRTPQVNFYVNQRQYNMTYYLADGIYPAYPTFVKSIRLPLSPEDKLFAERQESCRKDIERAFGVLQSRFKVIREPARLWKLDDLRLIMRTCIILHNMIVEDERHTYRQNWKDFLPEARASTSQQPEASGSTTQQELPTEVLPAAYVERVRSRSEIRDSRAHRQLQKDLVKHIWANYGNQNVI